MKTNLQKTLALLLLISIMISAVSCAGGQTEETADTADTAAAVETETETENPRNVQDEVPELDFGGAAFRSIVQESTIYDIYMEEETGDGLKDSVFYRNLAIEDRFNVVIDEALLFCIMNCRPV